MYHLIDTQMAKPKLPDKDFEWSPSLAYIIGLLVTDGCLSNDGRHIIMRSVEIDQLNTFKKCLELKNKIGFTDGQRGYRVQFSNVQFYRWLLKIGLFPAKTYTIGEIKIPDEFFRDFLRGHLDGDGNIMLYEDRYNSYKGHEYIANRLAIRFISASKLHMVWLRTKISDLAGIKGAFMQAKPRNENRVSIWIVKFSKKESIKLLNWLYYKENLPTLSRKRLLAQNALKIISKEKRKKYNFINSKNETEE